MSHDAAYIYKIVWLQDNHRDLLMKEGYVIKWKHFPRYWPFVHGIHRIPHTKASDTEPWRFLWSAPEPTVEQITDMLVIRNTITLIMT